MHITYSEFTAGQIKWPLQETGVDSATCGMLFLLCKYFFTFKGDKNITLNIIVLVSHIWKLKVMAVMLELDVCFGGWRTADPHIHIPTLLPFLNKLHVTKSCQFTRDFTLIILPCSS